MDFPAAFAYQPPRVRVGLALISRPQGRTIRFLYISDSPHTSRQWGFYEFLLRFSLTTQDYNIDLGQDFAELMAENERFSLAFLLRNLVTQFVLD